VRVTGDGGESATSIVLLGRRGSGDDVVAAAHAVAPAAAEAVLPAGAHGGPVRLLTLDGRRSARSARRVGVRSAARPGHPFGARVATRKAYVDTTHRAGVGVFVGGPAPEDVAVDLDRPADGAVLAHWVRDPALVAAGAPVATGQPIGFVGDTATRSAGTWTSSFGPRRTGSPVARRSTRSRA
jgi:hypothetical protein